MKLVITVCSLFAVIFAEEESAVVNLTHENFKETTKDGFWLVEFFAPWCGHCKKLAPTWEHLAKELKGKANIANIDCTAHRDTCNEFGVRGFPTIKLLENGQEKDSYGGARSASSFVQFLKDKAGLPADVNVADLPAEAPPQKAAEPPAAAAAEGPSDTPSLNSADFDEKTKEGFWFVKFYAPWCGHCKRLAPIWDGLATTLKGKANIAKVDCTSNTEICSRFGVRGYPTLKLLKDGAEFKSYSGARDADAFVSFLKENEVIPSDLAVKAEAAAVPAAAPAAPADVPEETTHVVVLTDSSFAEQTKQGTWFVKFYAPWCGHCKRLAPTWDELATKINLDAAANVKIAKVDCTKSNAVCSGQGVRGYPTLQLIKDGVPTPYQGGRDLASLTSFLTANVPAAPAAEAKAEDVPAAEPEEAHVHSEL